METIPEIIKKNEQKLQKFRVKKNSQPSENDRLFVSQILKRDAETNFKKLSLSPSHSEAFRTPNQVRKSLKSLRLDLALPISTYLESKNLAKSDRQERVDSRNKTKTIDHLSPSKYGTNINIAMKKLSPKQVEGVLTYFIGPGNNDSLVKKIMKKRKTCLAKLIPMMVNDGLDLVIEKVFGSGQISSENFEQIFSQTKEYRLEYNINFLMNIENAKNIRLPNAEKLLKNLQEARDKRIEIRKTGSTSDERKDNEAQPEDLGQDEGSVEASVEVSVDISVEASQEASKDTEEKEDNKSPNRCFEWIRKLCCLRKYQKVPETSNTV